MRRRTGTARRRQERPEVYHILYSTGQMQGRALLHVLLVRGHCCYSRSEVEVYILRSLLSTRIRCTEVDVKAAGWQVLHARFCGHSLKTGEQVLSYEVRVSKTGSSHAEQMFGHHTLLLLLDFGCLAPARLIHEYDTVLYCARTRRWLLHWSPPKHR